MDGLDLCREREIFAILIYPRKMDGLNSVFRFCDVYKIVYSTTEKIFRGTQPISRHCTANILTVLACFSKISFRDTF